MTTYSAALNERAVSRRPSVSLEISVPWRLLAVAIALLGTADIVAIDVSSTGATGMLFGAYGLVATASTMFITRRGRDRG